MGRIGYTSAGTTLIYIAFFEDTIIMRFIQSSALFYILSNCLVHTALSFGITPISKNIAFGSSAITICLHSKSIVKNARIDVRRDLVIMGAEPTKITMPALSSTMKEGRVVSWLKSEGDEVEAGEAIMVVESDKADMDVEAFEDGFLAKILVGEGESAPVGEVVALLVEEEGDIAGVSTMDNNAATVAAPVEESVPVAGDSPTASNVPDVPFSQVDMPALSSTMKEGKVVSWLKAEGDSISAGEAIMVVESDKADMDVEAFEDGFLAAIITGEGETGSVGAPVALIAENESDIPTLQGYAASLSGMPVAATPVAASPPQTTAAPIKGTPPPSPKAAPGGRVVASPLAKKKAEDLGIEISTVVGTGPNGRITGSDVENAASASGTEPKSSTVDSKPTWIPAAGVVAATPTAVAAAKKARIDLSTIQGTGKFGRVTIDDVKIATGEKQPTREAPRKGSAPVVELPDGLVPFTGMQRAVSKNMEATLATPVFRVSREIEMDAFNALYAKLKPKGVSVSALLAKACALGLEKYPVVNSAYSPEGTVFNKDINIAMAVAINGGLITPTIKYANERDIIEIGENWRELVGKAKEGKLTPDEYNSGTFAISNLGMFGVSQFDAILPPGMGGILAIGGTQEVIVPCDQAILGMRKVKKMTVTLTCDHRQIYGADAALFLKELANIIENKLETILL